MRLSLVAVALAVTAVIFGALVLPGASREEGRGGDGPGPEAEDARLGGGLLVPGSGLPPRGAAESPCDPPPWKRSGSDAEGGGDIEHWATLPEECREDYPTEWAAAALERSCGMTDSPPTSATELAVSLLARLTLEQTLGDDKEARSTLDDGVLSCVLRYAAHSSERGPEVVAQALLRRFSHVKTESTDPALKAALTELLSVVEHDPEWWRRFWLVLPRKEPFPLRYAVCDAIAAEFGWQGLYHVITAVTTTEDLMARGGASALAMYGRFFMRTLSPNNVEAAFFVPNDAKMRIVMLHAVPQTARWPFEQSPPLGLEECRRSIEAHLENLSPEAPPEEDVWRLTVLRNQLALQGPSVVLDELEEYVNSGLDSSEQAQLRVGLGLRWLDSFDEFSEIPGVSEQGKKLQDLLRRILTATSDADLTSLVLLMSRQRFLHPSDGAARERLMSLVPRERIDRLPTEARSALGL